MRTRLSFVSVALILALVAVAGCGGSGGGGGGGARGGTSRPRARHRGVGDQSFNDSAYAGLQRAKKDLDVQTETLESQAATDYVNNITQLADSGYTPIFAVGFLMTDAVNEIAPQYPDVDFAIVDSIVEPKNAVSLVFREQEGSYLAGVVAGLMTQEKTKYTNPDDKVVGFLGGQESDLIAKFQAGYEAGVESVCPDCEVIVQYAGSTPEAFANPSQGKEISLQQINEGADIIYDASGANGLRPLRRGQGKEDLRDRCGRRPGQARPRRTHPHLGGQARDNAVYQTIQDANDGNFPGGEVIDLGLKEDGLSLAPFGRFDGDVPQQVKDQVDEAQKGIISGDIKVPDTPQQ